MKSERISPFWVGGYPPFSAAHTAVKWKTNFLTFDVDDKLMNTDDTALMKYEKKFMQKAVSIMYTVFSFKKEHGRCFHPKSLVMMQR